MTRTTANEVIYKVNEVKNIMHENIERAAENCVKLESIDRRAEELMQDAAVFQTNARKLKRDMWWKNIKMWSLVLVPTTLLLAVIISIIYTYNQNNQ